MGFLLNDLQIRNVMTHQKSTWTDENGSTVEVLG